MKHALLWALLIPALLSCGAPSEGGAGGLPMGVEIRGLAPNDVDTVQITVLAHGTAYLCGELARTCLRTRVVGADGSFISDVLLLKDADGREHHALRFKVQTSQLFAAEGQTFQLRLPSGTNYMVVAEVLSPSGGLLASGCGVVAQVNDEDNAPLVVETSVLEPVPACDPRID
ncbi:MAG: hypothetical protein HY901_06805 [Deltaproteobacteria bacterium]|nr:hypothetical protein [Deltaproteobacteria bacterium]